MRSQVICLQLVPKGVEPFPRSRRRTSTWNFSLSLPLPSSPVFGGSGTITESQAGWRTKSLYFHIYIALERTFVVKGRAHSSQNQYIAPITVLASLPIGKKSPKRKKMLENNLDPTRTGLHRSFRRTRQREYCVKSSFFSFSGSLEIVLMNVTGFVHLAGLSN